jgi:lipopolysaccharide/colanic/teichoic acid biosynthesis glycosyltransferase/glycosyltransferase involved in cell wall biosynthesis
MIQRKPTRVLYLDHVPRMSGAEQSLFELVAGLSKGPIEPVVVLPGDGPLATQLRSEGILVRIVPMNRRMLETSRTSLGAKPFLIFVRLWAFLVASWRIHRIVREMRPQLIHSNTMKTHFLGLMSAIVDRVPLVWHVRDILPKGWVRRAFLFCARVPSLIVVPSRSVAAGLGRRRKRIHKKLRLIPNGVHVDELINANGAGKSLRAEIGANGSPLVGIVGRISPWKGQEVFIRAAAMLADRYPKAKFAVIGAVLFPENDSAFQERLQDLVAEAGLSDRIVFLGWRSTVEAMSALDILVQASVEPEPFGRTIVEGMAAGIPVVASSSGATRELLPPNAGILVPPNRPEVLADALDTLLADKRMREEMGANGQAIASSYFDVRRTIAGVGAMYQELSKKKKWRKTREPRTRMRSEPIQWPAPQAQSLQRERVVPRRAVAAGGETFTPDPVEESPPVKRLVARIDSRGRRATPIPQHAASRRAEQPRPMTPVAPRPALVPQQPAPAIAARVAERPQQPAIAAKDERTVAVARAIPAAKPATRRRLPDNEPRVPEHRRLTREAPVSAERAVATVPMRLVPEREDVRKRQDSPVRQAPPRVQPKPLYDVAKRALDLFVSLAVLVVGAPVWLLVALAIKLDSPGPVLFKGTVFGKDCAPFTYYKFRSMRVDLGDHEHRAFIERYVRHNDGHEMDGRKVFKFVGDRRITRIGRLIRKFSIDEVPQLFNVVKGQMSIVGPRPPLEYEYNLYDDFAKTRLAVLPGLTGLQQVRARHTAAFRDKIEMDLDYIQRRSVFFDVLIMLKSIPASLKGE